MYFLKYCFLWFIQDTSTFFAQLLYTDHNTIPMCSTRPGRWSLDHNPIMAHFYVKIIHTYLVDIQYKPYFCHHSPDTVRNNWVSTMACLCSKFSIFNVSWQMLKVLPQLNTLSHLYHIWELSNEVLYYSIPQVVSKIWLVKLEKSKFT